MQVCKPVRETISLSCHNDVTHLDTNENNNDVITEKHLATQNNNVTKASKGSRSSKR